MSGKLYVVGTPIGNLGDMTFRAVETLKAVDFICAEDTRVSAKLLNYFNIKKPLVSHHEHNSKSSADIITTRIVNGESCAIVTDAGMPCISDPGEDLVAMCVENGVEVVAVPGPTAMASALAISGLPTARFSFQGFLSVSKRSRYEHLASVSKNCETMIFYEAPHKLTTTLDDMLKYFGDRRIAMCRELTKIHEEVLRMTISEACEYYKNNSPRGEYVLVVEGSKEEATAEDTLETAFEKVKALIDNGMRAADACKQIAKTTGFSKSELYALTLDGGE